MSDQYARQAALRPADTNEHQLFSCPSSKQFQGVVSVCNQDTEDRTYSLARCAAGHGDTAADNADWRCFDTVIETGGTPHEITVSMAATETIRVKAGVADKISFVIEGLLMDA